MIHSSVAVLNTSSIKQKTASEHQTQAEGSEESL